MKLNKTFGRVATTLVAAAMLASLAAPVYATGEFGEIGKELSSITIEKQLVLPDEVDTPSQVFNFEIKSATVATEGADLTIDENVTRELYSGVGASANVTKGSVNINTGTRSQEADGNGNDTITADVTLTLPNSGFQKAGIYKYTIDETNDFTNTDYIDKTGSLDLYLIVERENGDSEVNSNDSFIVTGAFVYPANTAVSATSSSSKTETWVNYYKLDENQQSKVNALSFTKSIKGAMGNLSDTFTFEVAVTGVADGTTFKYVHSDNSSVEQEVKAADGKLTFAGVGNGDTITVKGLDMGESYVITEQDSGKGYVVTTDDNDEDNNKNDKSATLTVSENEETVVNTVFTNTRVAVSPTGLAMDIAPYALLVVVAAAGCFVFLRKRSED